MSEMLLVTRVDMKVYKRTKEQKVDFRKALNSKN